MCSNCSDSSSRARRSGPASTGRIPPQVTSRATIAFASASSPARNTSSGRPATCPASRAAANVVLNAFTTRGAGDTPATSRAISSAADMPGLVSSASKVEKSTGLHVSTTVSPASAAPCWAATRRPSG